jgi:hypothetical protein
MLCHSSIKKQAAFKEKQVALHPVKYSYMDNPIKQLDKATSDKISFITFIVPEFAAAYKMNIQDAYFYLKKYGGWDFLNKHWWALHTDNVLYTLHNIYEICYKNGGRR